MKKIEIQRHQQHVVTAKQKMRMQRTHYLSMINTTKAKEQKTVDKPSQA